MAGRAKKKGDWLRELGEESIRRVFAIAEEPELKPELRLQAYKFVAEHALGKGAERREASPEEAELAAGLGLEERRAALLKAAAELEGMGA